MFQKQGQNKENKNSCQHCRNYEFILSQLKVLKRQVMHKNQRIVQLEMFISKLSEMALNESQTGSNSGLSLSNHQTCLTFKNSDNQENRELNKSSASERSKKSSCKISRKNKYQSMERYYITESEPQMQGSNKFQNIKSLQPLLSKRTNQSTRYN